MKVNENFFNNAQYLNSKGYVENKTNFNTKAKEDSDNILFGNAVENEIGKDKILYNKIQPKDEIETAYGEYYKEFYNLSAKFAKEIVKKISDVKKEHIPKGSVIEEMASKFAKINNDIQKNFNGSQKEKRLKALTESYANAVKDNISVPFANSFWYAQGGNVINSTTMTSKKERIIRGISTSDAQNIFENVQSIALNAKYYYLDGNKQPVTKEEKAVFGQYISKDNDGSMGKWTYNQLLTSIEISKGKGAYDTETLKNNGFNKDSIIYLQGLVK